MIARVGLTRRSLFLSVIVVIVISNSIIFFAEAESREHYSHWIISINAAVAALLAIFIIYRQKHHRGLIEKADLALAIALSLSLCADIVWAIYEINLEIVPPVPSLADILSISAYACLAFYVYSTYFSFSKRFHFSNRLLIPTIIGSGSITLYIIAVTISLADFSTSRDIALFSVIIAYPILDAFIIVPSFLIVINHRKEPLWFTPWVCKSAGILLVAVSDSWFAFFVVTSLTNELWPSAMLFSAHNVIIAAGLLWYMKFLVTHKDPESDLALSRSANNMDSRSAKPEPKVKAEAPKMKAGRIRSLSFVIVIGLTISAVILVSAAVVLRSPSIWPLTSLPFLTSDSASESQISNSYDIVKIGALLPLTGVASSTGKSTEAALEMALEDINANFSLSNSSLRYELVIEDTESDPAKSLEKLKLLENHDIRTVIGPATSAELRAVKDHADHNDILLISHSSTAPSLAIEDDNVFRFVPDDTHQAEAISRLMWEDGVRVVIPFWRNDVYGSELVHVVQEKFQKMGGEFDMNNETLGYAPRTGQLPASLHRINFIMWDKDLRLLESKVQQALSRYDSDKTGVYMISLDEISPIFIQAPSHPALSKVRWYGSDGSVLNKGLVRNHESADFAVNTSFYNPIYRIDNAKNEKLNHIMEEIRDEIHADASPYSAIAYDILWVAAIVENATRHIGDYNGSNTDIHDFKELFVRYANSYAGITGNTTLNKAGDRDGGNYDFWAVRDITVDGEKSYAWQRVK